VPTAVAHPCSDGAIKAVIDAAEQGVIEPPLVGPLGKIRAAAEQAPYGRKSPRPASPWTIHFVYRIAREIGSVAAALDGVYGLVFTAGRRLIFMSTGAVSNRHRNPEHRNPEESPS